MSSPNQKRELRPMLPRLPIRDEPGQGGKNNASLYIGIMMVIIIIQLSALVYFTEPKRDLTALNAGASCSIPPPSTREPVSRTLDLIRNVTQGTNRKEFVHADEALNTIHLLSKYFRRKQKITKPPVATQRPRPFSSRSEPASTTIPTKSGGDDQHANETMTHEVVIPEPSRPPTSGLEAYQHLRPYLSRRWASEILHPKQELSAETKSIRDQCFEDAKKYEIQVDLTWGTMPAKLRSKFDELKCPDVIALDLTARHVLKDPSAYSQPCPLPDERVPLTPGKGMNGKVIALVLALPLKSLAVYGEGPLLTNLFPSFLATAQEGYEYWFYIGTPSDATNPDTVRVWFNQHVLAPLAGEKSIITKLHLTPLKDEWNWRREIGAGFNYLTNLAYQDGATYIHRIDHDQTFHTAWAHEFVTALQSMGAPNYGVVGPSTSADSPFLPIDFVHRTHLDIFPTYYPPSITRWFMGSWLSQVYGRDRTQQLPNVLITTIPHSNPTKSSLSEVQYLRGEIIRAREMVKEFTNTIRQFVPSSKD